ncbi:MAG: aldehyde dehydrogenase [Rhodobacteraceae bacterium]|jgi:aldehyde dehydrogenase (NAD+)|uniref:Aldehyde dehydrogenase (NAD+) n=1 Tax=Salipiger profundus TaxID=1229727 RepID=A0A1U7D7L0_9RHOB|nr:MULTISPECIES: aldehyde dehydrogenase family protein [Salipiger]APX24119.1 aldehyde dehydrogenase (NAD+) [Salipiger profundus]MAB06908.1 aldehyde dehydrogenase [Paracoccaceae bacterium]GFZ94750.1 aldehyde dehydrogenase [Salipiger profundus]SFB90541.1 aldehyde dehydrogenase (NAD+) [Salipiger profundus]
MSDHEIQLPKGHYIGGRYVSGPDAIEVISPSTGARIGAIPCADAELVDAAVRSAREALATSGWAGLTPRDRLRAMHAWAALIEENAEELARLEAICSSRPAALARTGDVLVSAEQIRFFAEFADKEAGTLVPTSDAQFGFISDHPYGVVGAITPWNFPISMAAWKLGPALAAGNAIVLKPSEMTPYTTLRLAELAVEAGIPAGLVNVVLGDGPTTGTAITGHRGIDKVSFTGSTRAGGAIMENIARTGIKPMTLELGGKSPMVVFADADLDVAAKSLETGIMPNAGQFCVAGSRILVEESIADALAERLRARFSTYAPTDTLADQAGFSPIISDKQLRRIDGIVQAAKAQGGEILCGGAPFETPGSYYQPTLISGVTQDSPAVTEEIFGPVATFQTFRTEDEAMQLAAHETYGLAAGLFTSDVSRALRLTRRLEAGTVWVNRYGRTRDHILPTGGWKASGLGKDLGREAYLANRRTKSVLIDL